MLQCLLCRSSGSLPDFDFDFTLGSQIHSCLGFITVSILSVSVSFWSWFSDSFRSQFPPNLGFIPSSRIHSQSVCHMYSFLRFPDPFGCVVLQSLDDFFPSLGLHSPTHLLSVLILEVLFHPRRWLLFVFTPEASFPKHLLHVLIPEACRFIRFQDAPIFRGFVSHS